MPVIATDPHPNTTPNLSSPPEDGIAVTPSDTDELAQVVSALTCLVSGAVRVVTVSGTTLDFYLARESRFVGRVKQVKSAGTAATGIVGWF